MGYNVYHDGEKINDEPLGESTYVDGGATTGMHEYYVTALYAAGESSPSETVRVGQTGRPPALLHSPPQVMWVVSKSAVAVVRSTSTVLTAAG